MEAKIIQRYKKKSIQQLIKIAERYCNKYIRLRDQGKDCVCCPGRYTTLEAGHFYSAGHYPNLRFDENNIFGQAKNCNQHLHGNLNEYRKNIKTRIGSEGLERLDMLAAYYKKHGWKWDRYYLIEKIEYYKNKIKYVI